MRLDFFYFGTSDFLFQQLQEALAGTTLQRSATAQEISPQGVVFLDYRSTKEVTEINCHTLFILLEPTEAVAPPLAKRAKIIFKPLVIEDIKRAVKQLQEPQGRHIVQESLAMKKIFHEARIIAKSQASVFIHGESGTGKEVLAEWIHQASERAWQPFIKVNCAAIPDTLIESEFFGHEKGAFTGAIQRKKGRFELASKGSLLLDEISEIPTTLQAKLLRVIQERELERVGGVEPIKVDVRLISTTNRDLHAAMTRQLFREDLFYRLNVIPIQIPPLRERKEDIPALCQFFFQKFCEENGNKTAELSLRALDKLCDYAWPGNVRELANLMQRLAILHSGRVVREEDLILPEQQIVETQASVMTLAELEKRWILQALQRHKNSKTKTAAELGISIRTLRNKLHSYKSFFQAELF